MFAVRSPLEVFQSPAHPLHLLFRKRILEGFEQQSLLQPDMTFQQLSELLQQASIRGLLAELTRQIPHPAVLFDQPSDQLPAVDVKTFTRHGEDDLLLRLKVRKQRAIEKIRQFSGLPFGRVGPLECSGL